MEKQEQWRKDHRLVLVPCPFQGHINQILQLGSVLHSEGFSITVAHTQFNFPNTLNHPDFSFLPLADGFSDGNVSSTNFIDVILCFNKNCKAPLQESLALMMEAEESEDKIACIIYDEYMYFAEAVAEHLKVPSMILSSSSATTSLIYYAIPQLLRDSISGQDADLESSELVPGLQPLRFKDLPVSNFENLDILLQLIAKARETRTSSAIVFNTVDCLQQTSLAQLQERCHVLFFAIGPFHRIAPAAPSSLFEEDTSCITWLDQKSHNSVLYVSLGSIAGMDKNELAEMAWGLANSKQPFLWVVRPDRTNSSEGKESVPEGFREAIGQRGYIVKWTPQKAVLAHNAVGGFWSHRGWNSTLESISEGVPMICQPYFGDQRANARYLTQVWRIGLEWQNNLERREVERAIRRLMVDEEGKEMRQRAMDLKEKIDNSIREGGSSYNSLKELGEYILSL